MGAPAVTTDPPDVLARKADRWDALTGQGLAPDAATAQVEREFADPGILSGIGQSVKNFATGLLPGLWQQAKHTAHAVADVAVPSMAAEEIARGKPTGFQQVGQDVTGMARGIAEPLARVMPDVAGSPVAAYQEALRSRSPSNQQFGRDIGTLGVQGGIALAGEGLRAMGGAPEVAPEPPAPPPTPPMVDVTPPPEVPPLQDVVNAFHQNVGEAQSAITQVPSYLRDEAMRLRQVQQPPEPETVPEAATVPPTQPSPADQNPALADANARADALFQTPATLSKLGAMLMKPGVVTSVDAVLNASRDATLRFTGPMERIEEELGVPADQRPSLAMRMATKSGAHADEFVLGDGPFQYDQSGTAVRTGLPSFGKLYRSLNTPELRAQFQRYAIAAEALEDHAKGRPAMLDQPSAQEIVTGSPDWFGQVNQQRVGIINESLKYLVNSGRIAPELADRVMAARQFYVRHLIDATDRGSTSGPSGAGGAGAISNPVMFRTNEGLPIASIYEGDAEYVRKLISTADRARPASWYASMLEQHPDMAPLYGTPLGDTPLPASPEGTALAQEAGMEPGAAEEVAHVLKESPNDDVLRVWRGGKMQSLQVPHDVGNAFRALSPTQMNLFTGLLSAPTGIAQTMALNNPVTAAGIFTGHTIYASVVSEHGFVPFLDSMRGLIESAKGQTTGLLGRVNRAFGIESPVYHEARAQGVAGGSVLQATGGLASDLPSSLGGDWWQARARAQRSFEVLPQSGKAILMNTVAHPIDALKSLYHPFFEAAYMGAYQRARAAGLSPMLAADAANTAGIDFAMHGSSPVARQVMRSAMFFNASAEAMDQAIHAGVENPTGVFTRGMLYLGAPTAGLWAANRGDQDIDELRKTQEGAGYWYVRSDLREYGEDPASRTSPILRIRKPHVFGSLFGTGVESALDRFVDQDPDAGNRFLASFAAHDLPNVIPVAAQLPIELAANYDFHSGQPIVPHAIADAVPLELQRMPHTSATARVLGQQLGISPIKFEYALRQVVGHLGMDVLKGVDQVIQSGQVSPPQPSIADMPVFGPFFARAPSYSAASIRTFYDDANRTTGYYTAYLNAAKTDPGFAQQIAAQHDVDIQHAPIYEGGKQALAQMHQQINMLMQQPMDPATKAQQIDTILRSMVNTARTINMAVRAAQ